MRAILIPFVFAAVLPAAFAADIPVAPGQSIQTAIGSASDGDRILVQPGTYPEAIDFLGKDIEVQGVGGAKATILDAAGLGKSAVTIGGGAIAAILDGFTVRNGAGTVRGGGIDVFDARATIRRCIVRGNSAPQGGGISLGKTPPAAGGLGSVVEDCTIEHNQASGPGGGIHGSWAGAEVRRCKVLDNQAGTDGGGVALAAQDTILSCEIRENVAQVRGGGVAIFHRNCRITACRIEENSAATGGGIAYDFQNGSPIPSYFFTEATVVRANHATSSGGGVHLQMGDTSFGGLSAAKVQMCTIASNTAPVAAALEFVTSNAIQFRVRGCIVWDHLAGAIVAPPTLLAIESSDVQGGFPGAGNQNVDPLFVDLPGGDVHLRFGSPCIGAGTGFEGPGPPLTTDFEGDPFVAPFDQGADEFHRHLYPTGDFAPGGSFALHAIGLPGEPVLLFASFGLAANPVTIPGVGSFLLSFPLLPFTPFSLLPIGADGTSSLATVLHPAVAGVTLAVQCVIGPALSNAVVLEG